MAELIKKNAVDSAGMPVGVQVIGMPYHEERVLGLAKQLELHFKFYEKHALPAI